MGTPGRLRMSGPEAQPTPIPVIVLTGFLGAGKTTLLNEFLSGPGAVGTAVIVNEFGDISIDHDLVQVGEKEVMVTTTGCICCTPGSDVRSSLAELMEARRNREIPRFERVVVETTGLADPAPVINQLVRGGMAVNSILAYRVAEQFALMGVVCAVDAIFAPLTLERHFECLKQVALADRIVITKGDLARDGGANETEDIRSLLREVNPTAPIVERHAPSFDLPSLFAPAPYAPETLATDVEGWLAIEAAGLREHAPSQDGPSQHLGGLIRTQSFIFNEPTDPQALDGFLSLLRLAAGSRLLRLKGLVALRDDMSKPVVVQAVQHSIHPPLRLDDWPSEDRRTRIVVIVTDIEEKVLSSFFDVLRPKERQSFTERLGAWTRSFRAVS